jgi:hypothetical protein
MTPERVDIGPGAQGAPAGTIGRWPASDALAKLARARPPQPHTDRNAAAQRANHGAASNSCSGNPVERS